MARSLSQLIDRLAKLAVTRPYFLQVAAERLGAETLKLIDDGFAARRDPYGQPWKATQRKNPILERTGTLRDGWSVQRISSEGVTVGNSTDYAPFHQDGTRYLVIRRMVPTAARGLGPIWGPRLKEIAQDALREAVAA